MRTPMPTWPSDRQDRDRNAVPAFLSTIVNFRPRAVRRAAIVIILISRPAAFQEHGKKRRVVARCGPSPREPVVDRFRWISRRSDETRSAWSSRRCGPRLRGRPSGRSESHAEIVSRARTPRGLLTEASECARTDAKSNTVDPHVGYLSSLTPARVLALSEAVSL